jgi:hypothetical protein
VKLFKWFTRIGLIAAVAVLGFGAGLAVRGWGDDQGSAAEEEVAPVGGDRGSRPIRLIRADPGALRRPARERSPESPAAPAAPAAPAPAAPPPAPAPSAPSPPPAASPQPPNDDGSDGPSEPPTTTFDSEG